MKTLVDKYVEVETIPLEGHPINTWQSVARNINSGEQKAVWYYASEEIAIKAHPSAVEWVRELRRRKM